VVSERPGAAVLGQQRVLEATDPVRGGALAQHLDQRAPDAAPLPGVTTVTAISATSKSSVRT
jgi:hypothetical protein